MRHGHLRAILAGPGFRRLYAVRLSGQFGDGVLQASLAGAVLFSPERQAHAADVAAGFAVLLVPYSLVGPFAGVLLDRWWRQRVLVYANVARAAVVALLAAEIAVGWRGAGFYASALVALSVSRFFLSSLSASLPHVVDSRQLVTANAFSTTSGTVVTAIGGGAAILARALGGGTDGAYALIALAAALPYLLAAALAGPFGREALGPDAVERAHRETAGAVVHGFVAGARQLNARRPALYALSAMGVHRLCYGLWTVCTVLLYRNYFHDTGVFRAGLTGLGQVVAGAAIGGGLAALLTPAAARRFGYARWPALMLLANGVVQLGLVLPYRVSLVVVAAFFLGLAGQSFKICVDTLVQVIVEDEFRGRVFTIYDTLFNLSLVIAAVLTAAALPDDGHAPAAVLAIGVAYPLCAFAYLRLAGRALGAPRPPHARASAAPRTSGAAR